MWDLESSLTTHQNTCKIFAEDKEAQWVDLRVRLQQSHQAKKGKMIYQKNEMEVEVRQSPGVLSCKCQSNVDFASHDYKTPLSQSELLLLRQETTHGITLKLTDGDNSSKSHMEKYTTEMQVDLDDVRDSNFVRSFHKLT